jgi:hypothetical protein
MTTSMPEYNGNQASSLAARRQERGGNCLDSSLFAPLNIQSLANEIYATPANGHD